MEAERNESKKTVGALSLEMEQVRQRREGGREGSQKQPPAGQTLSPHAFTIQVQL